MAAHERQLPRREFFKTAVATAAGLTIVPAAAVRGSQANSRLEIGIIGSGGRRARVDVGDCWDHFVVRYAYPNEALVDFSSAQFTKGYEDLRIRVYGASGTVDSAYEGDVRITGDTPWPGGNTKGLFQSGAIGNILDRLVRSPGWLRGGVVDFIDFQWFPIFNVADMAITIGGALLVISSWMAGRHASTATAPSSTEAT